MRLSFSSSQATILFSFYLSLLTLQWFSNPNLRLNSQPCITQKTCSQCSVSMQSSASMKYSSILPIVTLFFVDCHPFWASCIILIRDTCTKLASFQPLKMHIYSHLLSKIFLKRKAQKLTLLSPPFQRKI